MVVMVVMVAQLLPSTTVPATLSDHRRPLILRHVALPNKIEHLPPSPRVLLAPYQVQTYSSTYNLRIITPILSKIPRFVDLSEYRRLIDLENTEIGGRCISTGPSPLDLGIGAMA